MTFFVSYYATMYEKRTKFAEIMNKQTGLDSEETGLNKLQEPTYIYSASGLQWFLPL